MQDKILNNIINIIKKTLKVVTSKVVFVTLITSIIISLIITDINKQKHHKDSLKDFDNTLITVLENSVNKIDSIDSYYKNTNIKYCEMALSNYENKIIEDFSDQKFCINFNLYVKHIYNEYQKNKDINLLYQFFTFTTQISANNSIFNHLVDQMAYYSSMGISNPYTSSKVAKNFFKNTNKDNPKFKQWLSYVLDNDFKNADQMIKNYDISNIKEKLSK